MPSQTHYLPIKPTLALAFEKITGSKRIFLVASLLAVAIIFSLIWVQDYSEEYLSRGLFFGLSLFSSLMNFLLIAGVTYIGIRRAYNLPISFSMLLHVFKPKMALHIIGLYFLKILINFILAFVVVSFLGKVEIFLIGMMALIFIQIRLILALGFVLEKNMGPWVAIQHSFKATRYQFWRLFLLSLIQLGLYLVSILSLGILFIWTIPFTMISYGIVYRDLSKELEKDNPTFSYQPAKSSLVDFL